MKRRILLRTVWAMVCAFFCLMMSGQAMAQYQIAAPATAAAITENPVEKALKEGKVVTGATVTATSPDVAASLAGVGFDFLWIEMEHSGLTLEPVCSMILTRLPFLSSVKRPGDDDGRRT